MFRLVSVLKSCFMPWRGLSFSPLLLGALLIGGASAVFLPQQALAAKGEAVTTPEAAAEAPAVTGSPVVVDGATLFLVRGMSSYPSEQRAADISRRIADAAGSEQTGLDQLRIVSETGFSSIYFGKQKIMSVVDADLRFEEVGEEVLVPAYRDRIRNAIEEYRNQRSSQYLTRAALQAAMASALLILVLFVLRWLSLVAISHVERIARKHMENLEAKTFKLIRFQQLSKLLVSSLTIVKWTAILIAANAYLSYTLGLFPWTREFAGLLFKTLTVPIEHMAAATADAFPGLVFIILLIVVLRYFLSLLRVFFAGVADGSISWRGAEPDWAFPTYRLVRLFVIVFGLVMAYPYIPGSSSEAFKGLSLLFGLLLSLGASSIIGNILAGYSLIYRRAFKIGDLIKVGEHVGEVTEIAALVTHLRTPKNENVVVPNSEILSSNIVNYSALKKRNGLVIHTTVGIGYETPWRQVEAMLKMAADRTPGLLKEPLPFVLQKSLGDFCVVYEINAHTELPEDMPKLYSLLHQNILDVFNEYGVQIMTPAYESDSEEPKLVPKERWFEAPAQASPETGAK